MFKSSVLVTLMAVFASATAAPYVYGSPFYSSYSALPAAYPFPALSAAAYTAPPATPAAAALPAAAYPAAVPYPVSGLTPYAYGSAYSVQSPLVVSSPYYSADYVYGR